MPELIETRPFTIRPEHYAWPSFRLFSERMSWMYLILLIALTLLLTFGASLTPPVALLAAIALVVVAIGYSFLRYRSFLRRPANRQLYQNCIVSATGEEVRQDYTDGSYLAFQLFAVRSFRDLGGFYFIHATPRQAIAVPKSAFESQDDALEFARRIREGLGRKE